MRFSTRLSEHIRSNVVGYVAVFFALTGGAAWATHPGGANTISSGDIIDGEVHDTDIGAGQVKNADIAANAVAGGKVANDSLTKDDLASASVGFDELAPGAFYGGDIAPKLPFNNKYGLALDSVESVEIRDGFVMSSDIQNGGVESVDVANGTVQRVDLDEEAQGPAGFERRSGDTGQICNVGCTEGTLSLPPGFYAIFGKIEVVQQDFDEDKLHVSCELTTGGAVFDEAFSRLVGDDSGSPGATAGATLSMQGMRHLPERGNVNLNCNDANVGDVNGVNLNIGAIKLGSAVNSVAPPGD
jgi:hypothetical protein